MLKTHGILSRQEYGVQTIALSNDSAKAMITRSISGGRKHLTNLGYPESVIDELPDWFFVSPKFPVTVTRLLASFRSGNSIPTELETLVRSSPPSARDRGNNGVIAHSRLQHSRELGTLGEALKAAIFKSRKP